MAVVAVVVVVVVLVVVAVVAVGGGGVVEVEEVVVVVVVLVVVLVFVFVFVCNYLYYTRLYHVSFFVVVSSDSLICQAISANPPRKNVVANHRSMAVCCSCG